MFQALQMLDKKWSPEERFVAIKKTVKATVEEILGKMPRRTKQPWVLEYTLKLMDERTELKNRPATHKDV